MWANPYPPLSQAPRPGRQSQGTLDGLALLGCATYGGPFSEVANHLQHPDLLGHHGFLCIGHEEELGEAPQILARFGGPVLWQKVFSKCLAKNLCFRKTTIYLDMWNIFSHSSRALC